MCEPDRIFREVPEVAIQLLASERLKSTRSRGSTSERAIRTHDLEQTFASPFRAPVNRRSREPALVTLSGRVAPDTTSARSRACCMVGFVIPMPEGIGRGANSGLLASAEAGRHGVERSGSLASDANQGALTSMPSSSADAESGPRAEIMRRSGHGDRT